MRIQCLGGWRWKLRGKQPRHSHRAGGVSVILAMMFLVIFSSLVACMAVVAQGNLTTAQSALKSNRAQSAAEAGLVFGARRLKEAGERFVVERGVIDTSFALQLWLGSYPSTEPVTVTAPDWPAGYTEAELPDGIAFAVRNAHVAEYAGAPTHTFCTAVDNPSMPVVGGILRPCPIALDGDAVGGPDVNGPYFRLRYEPMTQSGYPYVRVVSEGHDSGVVRTIQMDFELTKTIPYAILSVSRVMIGKNVKIEGPLGTRYGTEAGELDSANGDPLVMKSDFYNLHVDLDADLDEFFALVTAPTAIAGEYQDTDGDGRLMINHLIEKQGLGTDPLMDVSGDEFVDDFDLFLNHFDTDSTTPNAVVYDNVLAEAAGWGTSLMEEFDDVNDIDNDGNVTEPIDAQLAHLIDFGNPDRDGDGIITGCGDTIESDCMLGYGDGVIDLNDRYSKVSGHLEFAVDRADWQTAHGGSYQSVVQGPIHPPPGTSATYFGIDPDELREINTSEVQAAQAYYSGKAVNVLSTPPDIPASAPPAEPEATPFEAKGAYDYFYRPTWQNRVFTDLRIPAGNNGLFINCIFVGVTFIETEVDCIDVDWNYTGSKDCSETSPGVWECHDKYGSPENPLDAWVPSTGALTLDTKPYSNNLRFHDCVFVGSLSATIPNAACYAHWRNKIQCTGSTRWYIDATDPDLIEEASNDLRINDEVLTWLADPLNASYIDELRKSLLLCPGWSLDIGGFSNASSTPVKLQGTIVTGILDLRGTAELEGTLLCTFRSIFGEGPLSYGGQTDAFNSTFGYFSPDDGDGEGIASDDPDFNGFGEITIRYPYRNPPPVPDGIPWPIRISSDSLTYDEGGAQ